MTASNITKTMQKIYGTGNFNPRRLDRNKGGRRIYIWGIGIFLLAVAAAAGAGYYFFSRTPGGFTGERVTVRLEGPETPAVGGSVQYEVVVENGEDVELKNLELYIDWASSAKAAEGQAASSTRATLIQFVSSEPAPVSSANNTWQMPDVKAGEEVRFPIMVRLNGREGDKIELPLTLTVSPDGFSSQFTVSSLASFTLGQALVELGLKGPETSGNGAEIALTVNVTARDNETDGNLSLALPEKFALISADPPLAEDADKWKLADLPSKNKVHTLSIRGTVSGNVGDSLAFVAELAGSDGATLARAEHAVKIQDASVSVTVDAAPAQGKKLQWGEKLTYKVKVANKGDYVLRNVVITLALSEEELWKGDSFDIGSRGFFEAGKIIWDADTAAALDSIKPGGSVELNASLETSAEPPANFSGTPALLARASARGNLGDQEVAVESGEYAVNILPNISFGETGSKSSESYSVTWEIGPTSGTLTDVSAVAVLPAGVRWESDTSYSVGELSYDPATGQVTWRSVRIPKLTEPINVRFGVKLNSTGSQSELIGRATLTATDAATKESLELYDGPIKVGDVE